jgi:transposase InsO family protein
LFGCFRSQKCDIALNSGSDASMNQEGFSTAAENENLSAVALAVVRAEIMTLHRSMAHPHLQLMQAMTRRGGILSSMLSAAAKMYLHSLGSLSCAACVHAKQTKTSVPKMAGPRLIGDNQRDGARIASDVAGPFTASRYRKYRYFIVFVHKRTRYSWVDFMQNRSEVFDVIKKRKAIWDAVLNEEVGFFISDNAKEYSSEALRDWFIAEKIQQRFSCPNSSAQNGFAERYIRTLREHAHALLSHSSAPTNLWAEAVLHANNVLNHTMRSNLHHRTPYQVLLGFTEDDDFLRRCRPFGCRALSLLPPTLRAKGVFDDKARECVFLGISDEHKDGYRLLHLRTNEVIISRAGTVDFFAEEFPWSSTAPAAPTASTFKQ